MTAGELGARMPQRELVERMKLDELRVREAQLAQERAKMKRGRR